MVYFTVRRNTNFGVPNANSCTLFDVKSGLNAVLLRFTDIFFKISVILQNSISEKLDDAFE